MLTIDWYLNGKSISVVSADRGTIPSHTRLKNWYLSTQRWRGLSIPCSVSKSRSPNGGFECVRTSLMTVH